MKNKLKVQQMNQSRCLDTSNLLLCKLAISRDQDKTVRVPTFAYTTRTICASFKDK